MEGETAAGAASATPRKEDGVSRGQWAPRATADLQAYKDSQDCRAAKVTRANEESLEQPDPKETWDQEEFLDSPVLMEFLDIRGKAGPEDAPAMTAATGHAATPARRDPPALGASPALPDHKDPKGRRVSLTHCLQRTATSTGANLESLDWSVSRGLPAVPGLWGQWVLSERQEDQDRPDPLDQKDSQATEDLVFMEKRVKRVTLDSQGPTGFRQTTSTPSSGPPRPRCTQTTTRVRKEVRENQEHRVSP